MIKEVTGDILFTKADALAHGVAPNDDFKQGLALSLREQWPSMYKDFRHFCQGSHPQEGELWSWKGAEGPAIVCLFTQAPAGRHGGHGGKATLESVNHCLKALKRDIETRGFKSIALPKLATGVGGMAWDDVKGLIAKHFEDSAINIYVYSTYKKAIAASEG